MFKPSAQSKPVAGDAADDFRGARVLVTGGFGFIGSHLAATLAAFGASVAVLDLRTDRHRESLVNRRPGLRELLTVVPGSLDDFDFVNSLIQTHAFEFIFNCASFASTIESAMACPLETVRTNTVGLVNLLESVRRLRVRPLAVVHASTDKVYGDARGEPYDEERTPLRARGVYDVSKQAADALARMYHDAYGLPAVVARLCNIFGPWDFNVRTRLVPRAMRDLFEGNAPVAPEVYEDSLDHGRDYLYVEDCVRALLMMASLETCSGHAFNLPGCSHQKTPGMLQAVISAAAMAERAHDPERAQAIERNGYVVAPVHAVGGLIAIPCQTSDGRKLREMTGFSPKISLEDGLLATASACRALYRTSPSRTWRLDSAGGSAPHRMGNDAVRRI